MSRIDIALRALDTNRRGEDYSALLDVPAQVPEPDLETLDRLVDEHPEHTAELAEIFTVAATAERSQTLDEDALDMLRRPRDVLAPVHGLSEQAERGVVAGLALVTVLLLVLSVFVDTPTVDAHPGYTTNQEVPVR